MAEADTTHLETADTDTTDLDAADTDATDVDVGDTDPTDLETPDESAGAEAAHGAEADAESVDADTNQAATEDVVELQPEPVMIDEAVAEPLPEPVEVVDGQDSESFEPALAVELEPEPVAADEIEPETDEPETAFEEEATEAETATEPSDIRGPVWDQDWDFGTEGDAVEAIAPEPIPEAPADESPADVIEPSAAAQAGADTGEVALMWLGSEFDDREEYAAEIEVGTAGWRHSAPSIEPDDELTRIAEDQGWDPNEVEAIRNLLEPAPPETTASEEIEPAAANASADEPAPGQPAPSEPAPGSPTDWPAADHSVTFTLPGGDELHRALEALGLPAPSRAATAEAPERTAAVERPEAPERAEPHEWSKMHEPEPGPAARPPEAAAPRPTTAPEPSPSHGEAPNAADPSSPIGEPEWLRGRRDPAARAFRRLRRIFPN